MARKTKSTWIQNLTGGMDQASDPSLVSNNESPLLLNVTTDQPGNWATRPGSDLFWDKISANPGYGLWSYNKTDGTHKLFAVADRDLFVVDETTGWGAAVDTDEWPADTQVNGIDFLNRSYIGSMDGATSLAYTTGSTITDVTVTGDANYKIGGGVLAVNQNFLLVGGNSIKPNVLLCSNLPFIDEFFARQTQTIYGTCSANADSNGTGTVVTTAIFFEANIKGAILYNSNDGAMVTILDWVNAAVPYVKTDGDTSGWDNDKIYVFRHTFKIDGKCTAAIGYGSEFLIWDEQKMYRWNPITDVSDDVGNFGCTSYRSVKIVDGIVLWANREGFWLYNGENLPTNITDKLRDRVDFYGVWDLISDSNWGSLAAGVREAQGQYILSVGTLDTLSGALASALTNICIVFDVRKGTLFTSGYQDRFMAFTDFINSTGSKDIYAIGYNDAGIWKLDTGTTDDDAAGVAQSITVKVYTAHHVTGDPRVANKVANVFLKYRAAATVTLKISNNRGAYATYKTIALSTTSKTQQVTPKINTEGWSHSLGFETTGKFILEGYDFDVVPQTTLRIPKV